MNVRSSLYGSGGDGDIEAVALMAIPSPTVSGQAPPARVSFRQGASAHAPRAADGAWWPRTRSLTAELPGFFEAWPPERGRIHRILYSPPDWDDHPRSVAVAGRRVKTGCFPRDDTHQLTVSLADRTDRLITVIAPEASPSVARHVLEAAGDAESQHDDDHPEWDNEGGQQ